MTSSINFNTIIDFCILKYTSHQYNMNQLQQPAFTVDTVVAEGLKGISFQESLNFAKLQRSCEGCRTKTLDFVAIVGDEDDVPVKAEDFRHENRRRLKRCLRGCQRC